MAGTVGGILLHRQAVEALKKEERNYRELVEGANSIIMRRDASGRITFLNKFALTFFGYTEEEIIGENVIGTIVPATGSDGRDLRQMIEEIGNHPENYATNINENMRSNGDRVWIAWTNRPILNEKGDVAEILCIGNDITARRTAEEKLKAEHEQLLGIIEFLPDATFVIDKDKKVIAWNRAIEEMTGINKEQIIGKGNYIYSLPFYGEPRPLLIDLIDTEDKDIESRYTFIDRKDCRLYAEAYVPSLFSGKGAYVWATASPLYNDKGEVIGSIESIRDITQQKASADEIRRRDLLLAGIAAASNALLIARDDESEINQALEILGLSANVDRIYICENHEPEKNRIMKRIFEWCREGIPCQIDNPIIKNISFRRQFQSWYSTLETGKIINGSIRDLSGFAKGLKEREISLLKSQGILSLLMVPIAVEGKLWGFVGIDDCSSVRVWTQSEISMLSMAAASIGEMMVRRSAQEQIRFQASLLDQVHNAVIATDLNGQIIYWNKFAEMLYQWKAEEVNGRNISDAIVPENMVSKIYDVVYIIDQKGSSEGEFQARRKDGSIFPAYYTFSVVKDLNNRKIGYLGVSVDITERKRVEEDLRKAKEAAESATRAKSDFLANMSHEIRTPMNAVIGLTGLMLNTELTSDQRDYVETIRSSGETLLALINDILDFSKIEGGKMELEATPFDLISCIEISLDLIAPAAARKGLSLSYAIEDGIPGNIIGDVTRLRQILMNLLSNAVKFTNKGDISIIVSSKKDDNNFIQFAVRDTGIGIPQDRMDRLFQSFSQIDTSMTRKYGGTGLGLAISKKLVELMGGIIWVESETGKGSTFFFTINAKEAPSIFNSELKGRKILVIMDEGRLRNFVIDSLESWSMQPHAATSNVFDAITSDKFDLAIFDMQMKGSESLAKELYGNKAIPIIALGAPGKHENLFVATVSSPILTSKLREAMLIAARKTNIAMHMPEMDIDRLPLRILLAEDNIVNQKVGLRMLERLGYHADVATNGLEVLEALERQPYDVILMDIQMPEMDGLEAARRIRMLPKGDEIYIIAITAHALKGDRETCFKAGMDAYISKPVRIEDLQDALEHCMACRKAKPALDPTLDPAMVSELRNPQINQR